MGLGGLMVVRRASLQQAQQVLPRCCRVILRLLRRLLRRRLCVFLRWVRALPGPVPIGLSHNVQGVTKMSWTSRNDSIPTLC